MAAVSNSIRKDITNLSDTLLRTKWLGLRNASSRIDVSSPRHEIRVDLHSLIRTNFSNTGTPVNRNFNSIKVQNRTLSGSEPNIAPMFEGGNLKLSLLQVDNVVEVRNQNFLQTLSYIQSKFFIPGVRKIITDMKKSCPGCIKRNKKSFTAFEADVPDVLKTVQPPFLFCQADILGPVLASQGCVLLRRWVLVVLYLSSRVVHLEILHNYSSQSITRGFRRTFALRGTPCIIWIDSGLNIVKAGKDLINTEKKVISAFNVKFATIKFRLGTGIYKNETHCNLEGTGIGPSGW